MNHRIRTGRVGAGVLLLAVAGMAADIRSIASAGPGAEARGLEAGGLRDGARGGGRLDGECRPISRREIVVVDAGAPMRQLPHQLPLSRGAARAEGKPFGRRRRRSASSSRSGSPIGTTRPREPRRSGTPRSYRRRPRWRSTTRRRPASFIP